MNPVTLAARLSLDATQWAQGLGLSQSRLRSFVSGARREVDGLRSFMQSTTGKLASLGASVSVAAAIAQSAKTDQALGRIQQTAGLTSVQTEILRTSLHRMAQETGNTFDSLQAGFGRLAAGGMTFDQALPTIDAINKTMRVTGSEAETLAGALQSAQTNFNFDLSKPGVAAKLLDQMTVAGRAGVIEIEDLAGVFGTAASSAKAAGLTFEQTLALFEGMGTATTKDRVGTLVDSTLRIFTNAQYMKAAQKSTGVKFFDGSGERRNALAVIADIRSAYVKLNTDKARFKFITDAFGKADLDTIKGIRQALDADNLAKVLSIAKETEDASGTIKRDIAGSMNNAVAQAGLLRETLGTAGDALAQPINSALVRLIKYGTGKKEDGGLELSGTQVLGGGAAAIGTAALLSRILPPVLSRVLGGGASLGSGIAMGTALEKAGAATPVFVVGAAPGLFSGGGSGLGVGGGSVLGGATGAIAGTAGRTVGTAAIMRAAAGSVGVGTMATGMGVAGAATVAAGVGAAAIGGYGIGTAIYELSNETKLGRETNDNVGRNIARVLAVFGNDEAQASLASEERYNASVEKERSAFAAIAANRKTALASAAPGTIPAWMQVPKRPTSTASKPSSATANGAAPAQSLPQIIVPRAAALPALRALPPSIKTEVKPIFQIPVQSATPAADTVRSVTRPQFANVRSKVTTTGTVVSAAAIGAAVAQALAAEGARRPIKAELDVRVSDTRTTVTSRGADFSNVRSSSTAPRRPSTGRIMGDRQ